ncbi:MAG: T9SS type A sorting domain-containing protein [Bacteroidota bacterium]
MHNSYWFARFSSLLVACLISYGGWACSCGGLSICEWIEQPTFELIVMGRLVDYQDYPGYAAASYLKVEDVIVGDQDISKTIKFYGNGNTAACDFYFNPEQSVSNQRVIWVVGDAITEGIMNPDSLKEDLTEYYPNICSSFMLFVEDGNVHAWVDGEQSELMSLSTFKSKVKDCADAFNDPSCFQNTSATIPNPVLDGSLRIWSEEAWPYLTAWSIYSMDGRRVFHRLFLETDEIPAVLESQLLTSGMYIVELVCEEARDLFKVVVQ